MANSKYLFCAAKLLVVSVVVGSGAAFAQSRGEAGPVFSEIPQNFPRETVRERGEKRERAKIGQQETVNKAGTRRNNSDQPLPPVLPPGQAGQRAGQAAPLSSTSDMSGMGVRATPGVQDLVAPDASSPFKYGTSPGQASNVPGVPFISPNGTSNFYGTGGRPIYLDKDVFNEREASRED